MLLNCDLGESFGAYQIGNDAEIIPLVDAVNIACGFHAGDPHIINQTVQLAAKHQVKIGAHPGFQDLPGFGRRKMELTSQEIYDLVLYQLGALAGFASAHHAALHHVKPHGALYNMACKERHVADPIVQAIADFDHNLKVVGLANSTFIEAAQKKGLAVLQEVFADRTYQPDGTLTSRTKQNSVISDAEEALDQVADMITRNRVRTVNGEFIHVQADTICVHGDHAEALELVKRIKRFLDKI